MVRNFLTHVQHGLVEDRLHERHASAATSACLSAQFDICYGLASAALDALDHVTLCHIVARANLGVVITLWTGQFVKE
jgi:hypothetical protein